MATFNYNGVGLRNVGSYMVSGHPYITGSGDYSSMHVMADGGSRTSEAIAYLVDGAGTTANPAEVVVQFPYVTKRILVYASGSGT